MSILNSNNFLYKTVDGVKQFFSPLVNASTVVLEDGSRLEKDGKVYADEAVNAGMLGGKAPQYYIQPRNLLDNSYFVNPINQRGNTSGTVADWHYFIDRWKICDGSMTYSLNNNGLSLTANNTVWLSQWVQMKDNDIGKIFTFACKLSDGNIYLCNGVFPNKNEWYVFGMSNNNTLSIRIAAIENRLLRCDISPQIDITIEWAALYEGEYTADNLPPYIPKGYAAELAECQRYYRGNQRFNVVKTTGNYYAASLNYDMVSVPSYTIHQFDSYGTIVITDFTECYLSFDAKQTYFAFLPTCAQYENGSLLVSFSSDL